MTRPTSHRPQWRLPLGALTREISALVLSWGALVAIAVAQTEPIAPDGRSGAEDLMEQLQEVPSNYEVGLDFVGEPDDTWPIITQDDTSLFEMTEPSLWFSREQMYERWGGYRLIRRWTAFHSTSSDAYIIDVQVDPQYWSRLEYAQQYAILNQLGKTGMSYGYQVRVYRSITLVGIHTCDFSPVPELADTPTEEVPIPELDISCAARIGPFIDYESFDDEDLFAPP